MSDNLPPGVTKDMLPGNTPEDAFWDKFYDANFNQLLDRFWEEEKKFCKELISETDKFYKWASDLSNKIYRGEESL